MTKPTDHNAGASTADRAIGRSLPPSIDSGACHVHLVKLGTLEGAYLEAKPKPSGAPGADGETFEMMSRRAVGSEFLAELAAELRDGTYKPRPYPAKRDPEGGEASVRVISIPTIRDRASCRAPSGCF